MFVAKKELINAVRLARLGLKSNKRGMIILAAIAVIVLLSELIPAVIMILRHNEPVEFQHFIDISNGFIVCVVLGIMLSWWLYHNENNNIAVFPQTNTARFLAYQIWLYSIVTCSALALMVIYLIQYGVIAALAVGRDNVHIIYDFNILLVLSGFVVRVIYTAIIVAAITLVAALLRKFRLYAAIFFTALFILLIFYVEAHDFVAFVLGFLVLESSLGFFVLKGITIWAVLFIVAFVINKHTVYYKSHSRESVLGLLASGVVAAVIVITVGGLPLHFISNQPRESSVAVIEEIGFDAPWQRAELRMEIDISSLPDGSVIDLQVSGDIAVIPAELAEQQSMQWQHGGRYTTIIFSDGTVKNIPGGHLILLHPYWVLQNFVMDSSYADTLHIMYNYPFLMLNGVDMWHLANPRFDIRFEGSTLYIDYTFEKDVDVILFQTWSFMNQFDVFRNQNLFAEQTDTWGAPVNLNLWIG